MSKELDDDSTNDLLEELEFYSNSFNYPLSDILKDKILEFKLRQYIRIWPNKDSKSEDAYTDLVNHFGISDLSENDTEIINFSSTRTKLSDDRKYTELFQKQNGRCNVCGISLNDVNRQIDHIFPFCLGGMDTSDNYQILCSDCNLGKSDSLTWFTNNPFFSNIHENKISKSLRYSFLIFKKSKCCFKECDYNKSNSKLHVELQVPWHKGGRPVFDNLKITCDHHYKEKQRKITTTLDQGIRKFKTKSRKLSFTFN